MRLATALMISFFVTPLAAGDGPDYWVYSHPYPTTTPDKLQQGDAIVERVFMTVMAGST